MYFGFGNQFLRQPLDTTGEINDKKFERDAAVSVIVLPTEPVNGSVSCRENSILKMFSRQS
jgi:hypothetical protein